MEKAIKEGYMTVGEVAKKMKVTVRTLQHYDKEGLLAPSAFSEGGRRLYTDKDLVRLHQILALKQLGFSLEAIKSKLSSLDTPDEVAEALEQQASAIREKISDLTESLREIEALKAEVLAMQSVDFQKYADIIVNLSMKNEFYWMIKHFDYDHNRHEPVHAFHEFGGLRHHGEHHARKIRAGHGVQDADLIFGVAVGRVDEGVAVPIGCGLLDGLHDGGIIGVEDVGADDEDCLAIEEGGPLFGCGSVTKGLGGFPYLADGIGGEGNIRPPAEDHGNGGGGIPGLPAYISQGDSGSGAHDILFFVVLRNI